MYRKNCDEEEQEARRKAEEAAEKARKEAEEEARKKAEEEAKQNTVKPRRLFLLIFVIKL